MSDHSVHMRFFGSNPEPAAREAAPHLVNLMNLITEQELGKDSGLRWTAVALQVQCDCCRSVKQEHESDWHNDGKYDYCHACWMDLP